MVNIKILSRQIPVKRNDWVADSSLRNSRSILTFNGVDVSFEIESRVGKFVDLTSFKCF